MRSDEEMRVALITVQDMIQEARRKYNKLLEEVVNEPEKATTRNFNDIGRLVGNLNAAFEHCAESLAAPKINIYCVLKHLFTAQVNATEVDGTDGGTWEMIGELTNGVLQACQDCKKQV